MNLPIVSKPLGSVNEFSSALWSDINSTIQQATSRGMPLVAAFDADGTLWDEDAGEAFFQWQIENCEFQGLPADPWHHYRELKKKDPHSAYGWLAQISAGAPLSLVRNWTRTCFESHAPWPFYQSVRDLIFQLHSHGVQVFIVTASVKWAVEPGAQALFGVPPERVLGISTDVTQNANGEWCITDRILHPVTYRQGKADALLKATGGIRPFLAAGNTYGDIQLLDSASDFKLMIQSQSPLLSKKPGLLAEEKRLRDHGRPLGWRLHAFRS